MDPHSLYLHIPFCQHRCGYCDFNTYAGLTHLKAAYAEALAQEVGFMAQAAGQSIPVHTIFLGGGTPSLLTLEEMGTIFEAIHKNLNVDSQAEMTVEVNPGTVDLAYMQGLKTLGINRISMGVQSANPQDLAILEREHGYEDAINAIKFTRQAGIDNYSVDLIFGVPYQTMARWQHSVQLALALDPAHISLYNLTIEHGTPLEAMIHKGLLSSSDPDLAADMYEWTITYLNEQGFAHYEISNWAKPDGQGHLPASVHNQQYWRNLPYLGLGAGAHGFAGGTRTMNVLAPAAYIQRIKTGEVREFPRTPATVNAARIDSRTEMGETMMMGLRLLREGVSDAIFASRFGQNIEAVYPEETQKLLGQGLIEWQADKRLRLTERGALLGNQVFMEFV